MDGITIRQILSGGQPPVHKGWEITAPHLPIVDLDPDEVIPIGHVRMCRYWIDVSGDRAEPIAAQIDKLIPLPAPEVMCGQIWSDGQTNRLVIQTQRFQTYAIVWVVMAMSQRHLGEAPDQFLLQGPGAPWSAKET
jgi:hypothetical protein